MRIIKIAFLGLVLFWLVCCAPQSRPTVAAAASFDAYFRQGAIYMNQGFYEKARQEYEKALALNPSSAKAHNMIGLSYFREKDYQAAEGQFLKAAAVDPSFAPAYNNLGAVYAIEKQWSAAKRMLGKAISLSPNMASAYFSLGTVHFNLGEAEEGTACFAKGIALDPSYLEKNITVVGLSMGSDSLAEAHFTFAKLYASAGDIERTVEFLTKAKQAGFHDWGRIAQESEFDKIRDHPEIKKFLTD